MKTTAAALLAATFVVTGCIVPPGSQTKNNGSSPATSSRNAQMLQPTEAQDAKLASALRQQATNKDTSAAIAESSDVISKFLRINSCITGYNASALNAFAAPGKNFPSFNYLNAPIPLMRYHDKGSCATVLRIQGWQMPTKNALQFEVVYTSDASGETIKMSNEVVRQPTGAWLFTR
ncbi:hypothetical protein [Variovorax rhizosphaerae]|uniref:DUF4019 domain-containing protein n=1 Tax=Variovorax rhizosphaerae TaxID=1836200 RepID=A0ABU8WXD1_9BURK